jgi:hypothetical protein
MKSFLTNNHSEAAFYFYLENLAELVFQRSKSGSFYNIIWKKPR